ncbi:MAG TPA: cupredoxin domain-containing protein [Candidatus Limnocylindrales bacterium]|nr:cupredoxin domain-containing protein [Candidatus Limnocylindrales bacterium]
MTDQSGREPEQRLPARRPPSEAAPAARFSAPESAHPPELSPERAAKIVSQSASARWVGFLVVVVTILFMTIYYFYEVGAPLGLSTPRLEAQAEVQQVTAIERGYNLYQANCARCHGPQGEGTGGGYIGPVLNDQMKLFDHLNARYIENVLTVGGRYVCGSANSLMPVWADTGGGPLNYRQIDELIAFLRAPSTQEFIIRNPELNEPVIGDDGKVKTFRGWVDPAFVPDPAATAVPACWAGTAGGGTPAPSESLPPDAVILEVTAEGIAFDVHELEAPAGVAFGIHFTNKDSGVGGHDVDIELADRTKIADNAVLQDAGEVTYVIPPLEPGTYNFICSVHPIAAMTGTLTVK